MVLCGCESNCGPGWKYVSLLPGLRLLTRAFEIQIDSPIRFGESISFVKKSAIRFGRCIRLINDNTPWHSPILSRCISHSAVQLILLTLRRLCEVVRVTHEDRVELTFDIIVNNSSLYILNRIEKIDSFRKIESEYFFLNWNALLVTCGLSAWRVSSMGLPFSI